MMRKMLQIGDSFLASVESIKVIIQADAAKVKNYMEKNGIEPDSPLFFDTAGEGEIRSLIIMDDGFLATSSSEADEIARKINEDNSEVIVYA